MKKAMDGKRPADRTQEDIDKFNKAVQEFNSMVNKSNGINNDLNKNRSALINSWNESVERFLDDHTPKYK